MEMCYNDALVMPKNFVVVNEEEMTYVDGGFYMTNSDCWAFVAACGIVACDNAPAIAAGITALGSGGLSAIAGSIPVIGWIVGIVGIGYLTVQAKEFSESLCTALATGQGVEVGLGFYWFVPKFKFTVK